MRVIKVRFHPKEYTEFNRKLSFLLFVSAYFVNSTEITARVFFLG